MSDYPIDFATFHEMIFQLLGIAAIESGVENVEDVENLEPIDAEMLPLSAYAHLPHATLWRTGRGLEYEHVRACIWGHSSAESNAQAGGGSIQNSVKRASWPYSGHIVETMHEGKQEMIREQLIC
ncbi:hypothetical protein ABEX25_26280 [Paenibacillus thiaminolyticus]|uniref:hypothetical protein n=1 Tax=Paenibacillus thiaminolyticus TaxID=49283 RepID=UPI003D2724D8